MQKFDLDYGEMRDGRYNRRPYGRYLTVNRKVDSNKASLQQLHQFFLVGLVIIPRLTSGQSIKMLPSLIAFYSFWNIIS